MKASTIVMSLITASSLALAASVALAHPGFGPGQGPGYGMGMMGGGPGGCGGPGMMGQGAGPFGAGANPLFTPEERTAFQERMRSATTPEERQRLMQEHRTQMQQRAAERGYACPGLNANAGK